MSTKTAELGAFMQKAIAYQGDECLLWPYGKTGMGYGVIQIEGRQRAVHRLICQIAHGGPYGSALHNCGVPLCINPRHLRWGSTKENAADRIRHGTMYCVRRNEKLTPEDVRQIRALVGERIKPLTGWPKPRYIDIAQRFGVKHNTIANIVTRKTWAWVD